MNPQPASAHVRSRMRTQRRHNTVPELELRKRLFAMGLRYRVGIKVPGNNRRTIDIAFPRAKIAVFVDGCFWHRCPDHSVKVKNNDAWWDEKLNANVARDRSTDSALEQQGWHVIRVWEHEDMNEAAARVRRALVEH